MSVAVIQLVIATPVQPDTTPADVANVLHWNAESAQARVLAIEALVARNWVMLPPVLTPLSDSEYVDVILYFAKPFASSDEAEAEAKVCGCRERENFSFLWNWDGTFDEHGSPKQYERMRLSMVQPGTKLVRRRLVWIVDEVSRTPDFSVRARAPGEQTGPWRALLRREDNTLPYREWVEVDSLAARGFRTHTEGYE